MFLVHSRLIRLRRTLTIQNKKHSVFMPFFSTRTSSYLVHNGVIRTVHNFSIRTINSLWYECNKNQTNHLKGPHYFFEEVYYTYLSLKWSETTDTIDGLIDIHENKVMSLLFVKSLQREKYRIKILTEK